MTGGEVDHPGVRPDLMGGNAAEVFGWLFDAYARSLHGYLVSRVGESTADDLVAETFLTAFTNRGRYDPQRAEVRSWLYGIATNVLRRHRRQELRAFTAAARAAGVEPSAEDGLAGEVQERVDAQARVSGLAVVIGRLPEGDRDVLLLVAWAGFTAAEVAETLDIPAGTVRSRLHRVRGLLRAELDRAEQDSKGGQPR